MKEISVTLEIFHFDISGIEIKLIQSSNKLFIKIIFDVFNFDKLDKDIKEPHL